MTVKKVVSVLVIEWILAVFWTGSWFWSPKINVLSPFPTYTNFHTVDHDFGIFKNCSGVGTKFVVDRSNSWCALMDHDDT